MTDLAPSAECQTLARPYAAVAGIIVMVVALGLGLLAASPPTALPASAPAETFSSGRAMALVERLLGDGVPHPLGTEANARVADRISAELTELGYQAERQEAFACSSIWAQCGFVSNLVSVLPGQQDGPAVLLTAHYDSVAAGPGAADDMAGVAVMLEIARILRAEPPPLNPVIFLFSDGEEYGLLGAEAFVAEHPQAADVGMVINLEANGTRGQSILFETSDDNAWIIDAFAPAVPRPVASSLFYEIYKYLPHNTDLTVYKAAGIPGLNFALTEGGEHYHTPLDSLVNLDPRSVQHHGDNALAAVRAFSARDLTAPPPGNSVFIDLLPGLVVRWPEPWTMGIALASLAVWFICAASLLRRRHLSWRALLWGSVALPLGLIAATLLGAALSLGASHLTGTLMPWYAHPLPLRVAIWVATFLCIAVVALLVARRSGFWGLALGVWLWWALLSTLTAWALPGASVLVLLPAVFALLALAAVALTPLHTSAYAREIALLIGLLGACWFWLPFAITAETMGFGPELGAFVGFAVGLAASGLLPLLALPPRFTRASWLALGGVAAVMAVAFGAALMVPAYSAEKPQRLNVLHVEDRSVNEAFWGLEGSILAADGRADVPDALFTAARFAEEPIPYLPWSEAKILIAPAPPSGEPAPAVEILGDDVVEDERLVTLRLGSPRGGHRISLYVPERGELRRIDITSSERSIERFEREKRYDAFHCFGAACDGLELTLRLGSLGPVNFLVVDSVPRLPAEGADLLRARPEAGQPSHEGDRSLLIDWVSLAGAR